MPARHAFDSDAETFASGYFERFTGRTGSQIAFALENLDQTWRTLIALRRLPRLVVPLSEHGQGALIRHQLHEAWLRKHLLAGVTSVLALPDDPATYTRGSSGSKYAIRKRSRTAADLGVRIERVDAPEARHGLADIATAYERVNPRPLYQINAPSNGDMPAHRHWFVAKLDGRPIMLAVLPSEGEWAALRYFRTLEATEEATLARYLMMTEVVRALRAEGVRYIAAGIGPHRMGSGIRHFARMMGFRIVRVRVTTGVTSTVRSALRAIERRLPTGILSIAR